MAQPLEDVYCTLLMSDSYLPGAAVLAHSLRDAGTTKKLAVLVTLDTLSAATITRLETLYDYLIPVDRKRTPNPANLYLMGRPDLSFAFTKLALWRQTQFRKIVYLDADVVALRALDELFAIEASFAAAPDIGWPDAFNSGVMVITPDMGEYWALQTMVATGDSFDGADQGLLNQYFEHRPYHRLKFTYNCTPNAEYQWEPAYRYYKSSINAVHFIGKEKPWSSTCSSAPGIYGELLSRWWQVHNRHLGREASGTSQSPPGAPGTATELPMSESGGSAENIDSSVTEPTPTEQLRKFSAPEMQWDATQSEPPAQSRPEAANFPRAQYTFSDSHQLFKAPQAYPDAPRDMWYKVPENRPKSADMPKAIFPWEHQLDRPIATRVFAEDFTPEPTPEIASPTHPFSTVHYEDGEGEALEGLDEVVHGHDSLSSPKSADMQWQSFQQSNVNAWDSVPGIDNYVRAVMDTNGRRNKPQTLQQTTGTEDLGSPLLERRNRRESLLLTDFPTAIERPSLPVTPAVMRRPSFWGEERGDTGELPAAAGVPDQTEWNPNARLEQLRRSSLVEIEHLTKDPHPDPPLRALPEHSVLEDEEKPVAHPGLSGGASPQGLAQFGGLDGAAMGIARVDFAQKLESRTTSEKPIQAATEELFFTPQGLSAVSSSSAEKTSSSSTSVSQQTSSSSLVEQASSGSTSASQQNQYGNTAFTLPDFGQENEKTVVENRDEMLSPTQYKGTGDDSKGDGLF